MRNSNKILIFSTAYYPFVGGAEVAVKEITNRISDFQFDLITARFDSKLPYKEKIGNVFVYRVGFGFKTLDKLMLPFLGAFVALKLDRKNNYKFYWCIMTTFASGAAYIANILKFWRKVPVILNLQEGDSEEHFRTRWFGLIDLSWKLALSRTKILTVLSNYLKDRAQKFGYEGNIFVIPNGVDTKRFDIDLNFDEKLKIKRDFGFNEKDIILVTTSRLVIKNAVIDVIKSLNKLEENIKFLVLGNGPLEESLKLETKKMNLENRVIFKGYVSHDEMPKILKSCDIFIRPSLSEGFGVSFIEAMATKIPVIATPVGGIVDFLKDHETGYFCNPGDPDSIADTIKRVLADPNKNKIIENAYKLSKEKYNWGDIASQMGDILKN